MPEYTESFCFVNSSCDIIFPAEKDTLGRTVPWKPSDMIFCDVL